MTSISDVVCWQHFICIAIYTSILGVGCWRHYTYTRWRLYIHTSCWMLATLHLYQVLDVGDTIHVPISGAGDNTLITDVGCWRQYTCTHIPGVFIPMVYQVYITDSKTNILSICNKTDLKMSATVYLCLVFA